MKALPSNNAHDTTGSARDPLEQCLFFVSLMALGFEEDELNFGVLPEDYPPGLVAAVTAIKSMQSMRSLLFLDSPCRSDLPLLSESAETRETTDPDALEDGSSAVNDPQLTDAFEKPCLATFNHAESQEAPGSDDEIFEQKKPLKRSNKTLPEVAKSVASESIDEEEEGLSNSPQLSFEFFDEAGARCDDEESTPYPFIDPTTCAEPGVSPQVDKQHQ